MQSVAQVVWKWRSPPCSPGAGVRARHRRSLIQGLVTAGIATLLILWLGHPRLGLFLYFMSAVILICGFLLPSAFVALEKLGQKLAHVVGTALTWLLLVPFFYLCFALARLILTLSNKDPMARRYESERVSYWENHKPAMPPDSYTRPY